jgi:adenine deaminase
MVASSHVIQRIARGLGNTRQVQRRKSGRWNSGIVEANLYDDLLKVAMFDRHQRSKHVAFGFLKGFGAKVGAVGLTANLDENELMVAGSDDEDMALCANTLLEAGGGIAMVDAGEILELLKFPVGGIFLLHPGGKPGGVSAEFRRG